MVKTISRSVSVMRSRLFAIGEAIAMAASRDTPRGVAERILVNEVFQGEFQMKNKKSYVKSD